MGKSEEDVKKMVKKETAKAPISPIWLGMRPSCPFPPKPPESTIIISDGVPYEGRQRAMCLLT